VARKGHMTAPPTAPNPAAEGKSVWVLQSYAPSESVAIPAKAAEEAGKALGWDVTLFDAKGDPGAYVKGVSQAIANGADGIVLIAIDCSYVRNQLQDAKKKGIFVTEIYAFDCDDTNPGQEALFTADLSFGDRWGSLIEAWNQWGEDTAAWITEATNGEAKPMMLDTDQIAVLRAYQDGFYKFFDEACPETCEPVKIPWNVVSELTPAAITNLHKSQLLKTPDVNASAFGSTVTSGYNQAILALGAKGREMKVIAGLGLPSEFALIKEGKGLNATTAWPQEWIAYAAMDSLNLKFNDKELEDQGLGWQIIDNTNAEAMPQGDKLWQGDDNFRDDYKKRWAASGDASS
jgi:ribose transport system substrate-binding protein